MGDRNQLHFLKAALPVVDGPVLEIGSREYGNTSSFREVYKGEYVGLDLKSGKGVDVVQDLTQGIGELKPQSFALVICCSVLEHVSKPWLMAENITKLVRPCGILYVSVPWVWRFHEYPDDYWRFSWRGVREMFPAFEWGGPMFSTTREHEFFPAEMGVDNERSTVIEGRKYLPYLMLNMMGVRG